MPRAGADPVRTATAAEVPEVVRLAELMYRSLGASLSEDTWARWRQAAERATTERLGHDLAVVVAEDPGDAGHLVSCGVGTVSTRLPNPWHDDDRVGYIQWMSTEPAFQRRGLARAVLRGLLQWFEALGIGNVELHASGAGAPLYRSEGFWEGSTGLALRHRAWDPPPAAGAPGTQGGA
ncbi:MAG TPA: GNAT family N-acetyltransferase [Acidimicrobiales bacterium]|nr:GNAT family N-acetyltransferase [Acidimicrobiales bacterium]